MDKIDGKIVSLAFACNLADSTISPDTADSSDYVESNPKITIETKDYSDRISSDTMKKIMNRVPESSLLHIVVVNKVQTRYSLDKWSNNELTEKARKCIVRQFDSTQTSFKSITGMPEPETYDCLVLFYEIEVE